MYFDLDLSDTQLVLALLGNIWLLQQQIHNQIFQSFTDNNTEELKFNVSVKTLVIAITPGT